MYVDCIALDQDIVKKGIKKQAWSIVNLGSTTIKHCLDMSRYYLDTF